MPGRIYLPWRDGPSPKMEEYFARNPKSIFARMYARSNDVFGRNGGQNKPNPFITGSNNAPPAAPVTTQPAPTPQAPAANPLAVPQGGGGSPNPFGSGFGSAPQVGMRTEATEQFQQPTKPTVPSFAAGGLMGEDGQPVRPGAPMSAPSRAPMRAPAGPPKVEPALGAEAPKMLAGAQLDKEAQQFVQRNPQQAQQVQALMAHAMQTGELTYEELNMAVQLAKAALANPSSWPQIRQFAIENGLGTEQDLPAEYDQGLLFVMLVVGKSLQQQGTQVQQGGASVQGDAMMGQPPSPTQQPKAGLLPSYDDGGKTKDGGAHLAVVHSDEYVIPKEALLYHGKKTFDALVEKARNPDGNKA